MSDPITTHPIRQTSRGGFGPDDELNFQKSRKFLPTLAWYLLNPLDEIRFANDGKPAGVRRISITYADCVSPRVDISPENLPVSYI